MLMDLRRAASLAAIVPISVAASGCAFMMDSVADTSQPVRFDFTDASTYGACQLIGAVIASADCDCYDKMSYDRVKVRASENLRLKALDQYPGVDRLEISSVDLYLNNAVAHGQVYDCTPELAGRS